MYENNDIEVIYTTKHLPIDYKILEWRLLINRKLYEEKTISLKVFSEMEKGLLGRMTKMKNEFNKKDDLANEKSYDDMLLSKSS